MTASADAGRRQGAKSRKKITNKIMSKHGNGECKRRREVGDKLESTRQQLARARGRRQGHKRAQGAGKRRRVQAGGVGCRWEAGEPSS